MTENNEFNIFEVINAFAKVVANATENNGEKAGSGKSPKEFDELFRDLKKQRSFHHSNTSNGEHQEKVQKNTPKSELKRDEADSDSVIFGLNLNLPMPEELMEYLKENEKAFGFFEENTSKQPFTHSGKCCGDDQNDEDELEDDEDLHEDGFDGRVISNETIRDVVDRLAVIEAKMLFGTLLGKELCLEASSDLSKLRKMFEEML